MTFHDHSKTLLKKPKYTSIIIESDPTHLENHSKEYSSINLISHISPNNRTEQWMRSKDLRPRRGRRFWIIVTVSISAIIVVILILGLSIGLTISKRRKASPGRLIDDEMAQTAHHSTPENDLMAQMFEWNIPKNATHWNTLSNQMKNLKILGVKNLWIPPATKNVNRSQIGYDVYDLWDLGEFDAQGNVSTNMGTKRQLEALTQKANDSGIGIIFDAVFNQRSGAEGLVTCQAYTVDENNRLQVTSSQSEIDAWLQFKYPARNGKYSLKQWGCDDFTAVDYDQRSQQAAIYKIVGNDNSFETDVSYENGNDDYLTLADVAYRNPSVKEDVLSWVEWIHDELTLHGFRLDAAKHVSASFILQVLDTTRDRNNGVDKFAVAEYFTSNLTAMTDYLDTLQGRVKLFDTPLLTNFAAYQAGNLTDMRQIFTGSLLASHPDNVVTFVVNHDTQPGQSLDSLYITGWFLPLAYAISLLRNQGLPCLFYGDIYGTYDSSVSKFTTGTRHQIIANLAIARKYWAYGNQTDYSSTGRTIGWTRTGIAGDRPDGLAVVMSNDASGSALIMNVGTQHAGEVWTDTTQNILTKSVIIDAQGNGVFPVRGQSVSVWVNRDAVEGREMLGKFNANIYGLESYDAV